MPPKKTLTAKNLEALGAERLAELLVEIGDANAAVKRPLRLEFAGAQSPDEASREIRKRLNAIARARGFVDWQNRLGPVEDLRKRRRAIVDQVGKTDPKEAIDLMWNFMAGVIRLRALRRKQRSGDRYFPRRRERSRATGWSRQRRRQK